MAHACTRSRIVRDMYSPCIDCLIQLLIQCRKYSVCVAFLTDDGTSLKGEAFHEDYSNIASAATLFPDKLPSPVCAPHRNARRAPSAHPHPAFAGTSSAPVGREGPRETGELFAQAELNQRAIHKDEAVHSSNICTFTLCLSVCLLKICAGRFRWCTICASALSKK